MFKNMVQNYPYNAILIAHEEATTNTFNIDSFKKCLLFLSIVLVASSVVYAKAPSVATSYYVELEEFRWTSFPLKVFVEMNQWSTSGYAFAVREALDSWVRGAWNFTQTYNVTSLDMINYVYYVDGYNHTDDVDIFISFSAERMPPSSSTVGLTTYRWDTSTREPIPPITINITTFYATATDLFVKNIAMHEFGHALGLGHASHANTLNGPELMYYTSTKTEITYPSTLDVYGLTVLYSGNFKRTAQLPSNIPYVMLAEGYVPPPVIDLFDEYKKFTPILGVLVLLIVVAVVLTQVGRERRSEEVVLDVPTPSPEETS